MPLTNASDLELYMLKLVNEERTSRGLDPLLLERHLNHSADAHSQWMLDTDTFSHTGRNGSSHDDRIRDSGFDMSGSWRTGENIGAQSTSGSNGLRDEVREMMQGLMDSPGHRANILSTTYDYAGIGLRVGEYQGRTVVMGTQHFGATDGDVSLDPGAAGQGGDGDETISGTMGPDWIFGGGGDDMIRGRGGRDTIEGGDGHDRIRGGDGDDSLTGDRGHDTIEGGKGDDTVWLGSGRDRFIDDSSSGADLVHGGEHNDVLTGRGGHDTLHGEDGHDRVSGGNGHDKITGGRGHDLLRGGSGDDTVQGGGGDDDLRTGRGEDMIWGGDNDDRVSAGSGSDEIWGGHHDDRLSGGNGPDVIRGEGGHDRLWGERGYDMLWGGRGHDHLDGGNGNDVMGGGGGDDTFVFRANEGDDTITDFGDGDDTLRLDDGLWQGSLYRHQVVDRYAEVTNDGVLFTFDGGETLLLEGRGSINGLADEIEFF